MAERNLPGLGLRGFWPEGSDHWGDENDVNLRMLSALTQAAVIDTVAAVPGAPADGDIYLLTNDAAAHAKDIAIRDEGAWVYLTPAEGWLIYDRAANAYKSFDGAAWAILETGGGGGGVEEAPEDGTPYARQDAAWVPVVGGGGGSGGAILQQKMLAAKASNFSANFLAGDVIDEIVSVGDFRGMMFHAFPAGDGAWDNGTTITVPEGKVAVFLWGDCHPLALESGSHTFYKCELYNVTNAATITSFYNEQHIGNAGTAGEDAFGAGNSHSPSYIAGEAGDEIILRVATANDGTARTVWVEAILAFVDATTGEMDDGAGGIGGSGLYRFGSFFTAEPGADEVLMAHPATDAFTLPANLTGSQFVMTDGGTNPSGTTIFSLQINGVEFGTVEVTSTGVVTLDSTEQDVVAGDVLALVAPADSNGMTGWSFAFRSTGASGGGGGTGYSAPTIVQFKGGRAQRNVGISIVLDAAPTPGNMLVLIVSVAAGESLKNPQPFIPLLCARPGLQWQDSTGSDYDHRWFGQQYQGAYVSYMPVIEGDGDTVTIAAGGGSEKLNVILYEIEGADTIEAHWSGITNQVGLKYIFRTPRFMHGQDNGLYLLHVEQDDTPTLSFTAGQGVTEDFVHITTGNHVAVSGHANALADTISADTATDPGFEQAVVAVVALHRRG